MRTKGPTSKGHIYMPTTLKGKIGFKDPIAPTVPLSWLMTEARRDSIWTIHHGTITINLWGGGTTIRTYTMGGWGDE